MLETNPPIYFKRNLTNMINICNGNNIDIILSTFASSNEFPHEFVSTPEYVQALQENNELIREVSAEQNVACFDFSSIFPKDKTLYTDGRHVNEKGVRLKSILFADYIAAYIDSTTTEHDNNIAPKHHQHICY